MNVKKSICLKMTNIAKALVLGCIFLFCFLFSSIKVGALNIDILSSTYTGNGNNNDAITINGVKYIQGTGVAHQDGITFKMSNIYSSIDGITSISVWESHFAEDSQYKDYDRWYVRTVICDSEDDCGETWDLAVASSYTIKYLDGDNKGEVIYHDIVSNGKVNRYYLQRSASNIVSQSGYLTTVVDFDKFFSSNEITYTYRIRNFNALNRADRDGFGYKRVDVSLWKASNQGGEINYSTTPVFFGLAKAIDDVDVYTNYNKGITKPSSIACGSNAIKDMICIDYVDTNGDAESTTIVPKDTNIYLPDNVLYAHYATDRGTVEESYMDDNKVDLNTVAPLNSLYALNYFCEGVAITLPTFETTPPSCTIAGDKLREYLYVEAKLIGDTDIIADDVDAEEYRTSFRDSQYQIQITVDSAGGYVVYVRDRFGNVNSSAIIKVSDIINRAIISYFEKSNKTDKPFASADGWKADEYLTNQDVTVTISMTATTVIEQGLPVIGAETTLLDASYVKLIQYWRVDGSLYDSDICVPDADGKFSPNCAKRVTSGNSLVTLYNKPIGQDAQEADNFNGFDAVEKNKISLDLPSNGRYRFYIELYGGNNTNENIGETKNPRVEIYKIDKEAPEITYKSDYKEGTYTYYQGSGIPSGTIVNNLYNAASAPYTISYTKNGIYYVTANGKSSLLSSASDSDVFYHYIHSIYNSGANINENIRYYKDTSADITLNGGNVLKYSHFAATNNSASDDVEYVIDNDVFKLMANGVLSNMSEEQYREYIIRNNIKYTAFSLANNTSITFKEGQPTYDYYKMKIEYYDASESDKKVCDKLAALAIDLGGEEGVDKHDCVNYYLDHGLDFIIKITAYDVVQDSAGNYIIGNEWSNTVNVDVEDTTAPGFSSLIKNYNLDSECRIEIGGSVGSVGQAKQQLLECYEIYSSEAYHIEDNVFAGGFSQQQTVNTIDHVHLYMLNRSNGEWISFDEATGYEPDRSGNYTILAIIQDDAWSSDGYKVETTFNLSGSTYNGVVVAANKTGGDTNAITVKGNAIATVFSYFVDKRIVLISPEGGVHKDYGEEDPLFNYTVYINKNNTGIASYLAAPFKDMTVFSEVGTTTNVEGKITLTVNELKSLFKFNYGKADFTGVITRQESALYNGYHTGYSEIYNNYVGEYKLVLGSLTIANTASNTDDYDLGEDYIVKINPNVRNDEYQLVSITNARRTNGDKTPNLVLSMMYQGAQVTDTYPYENGGCYGFAEDDDFFVESDQIFTIRQVILTVRANGSSKIYGEKDTNYNKANLNTINSSVVTDTNSTNVSGAYLGGYIVEGLKTTGSYNDNASIVLGVLRREVGENVGIYSICNFRGEGNLDTKLETYNNMLIVGENDTADYKSCIYFDEYANTVLNTGNYKNGIIDLGEDGEKFLKSRALYIAPNVLDGFYKVLNSVPGGGASAVYRDNSHANYLISYVESQFTIEAATIVVQPTPGQRREYSYAGVDEVNPWEVIVYGEKSFTQTPSNANFNGYTANSPVYTASENDVKSVDTANPVEGEEAYNNASEAKLRATWTLILDEVTYTGKATNETYSLLEGRLGLVGKTPTNDGVYKNMGAGWYEYNSTLSIIGNTRKQCGASNGVLKEDASAICKNYNLVMDYKYRDVDGDTKVDDGEGNEIDIIYKSKLGYCQDTVLGTTSDPDVQCSDALASKILFEVYRREIIMEFNSLLEKIPYNSADIVYGYRYDYYYNNLFNIATNSNNKNHLENYLFYCYASYKDGLVGTGGHCSDNEWYGLTKDDTWVNVGLTFKLHSIVSANTSEYYDASTDDAIPAGRYYVYANISDAAENNYKFNYLGGTLTIKTKTTGITLTSYSKEYGDVYFKDSTCLKDYSLLSKGEALIDDCSDYSNENTNTYGFIVNGLDSKDTIADNFKGRPFRVSNLGLTVASQGDAYGLQENVGIYSINQGNIYSINNNSFTKCSNPHLANNGDCVVVEDVNINNYMVINDATYDIEYYLLKNGTVANNKNYISKGSVPIVNNGHRTVNDDATLTITPATITITVSPNQTKMYGCAYNSYNINSSYSYSYTGGYDCIENTGNNYDFGYKYTVVGDKDYYIYNKGYYTSNFASVSDSDLSYTSDAINQVSRGGVVEALLLEGYSATGLRSSALNGGVLYRSSKASVTLADIVAAGNNGQAMTHYQGQSVGSYYITLGNMDATIASLLNNYVADNNKVCDASNTPGNGNLDCKNYIISYYGNTSVSENHNYASASDTVFTITTRVAFIYAEYNSKVYGNNEPLVTKVCNQDMIDAKLCSVLNTTIEYGLSYYYTKANSLAKEPWVASIEGEGELSYEDKASIRDDVQTDVVSGKLSRVGMNNSVKTVDDIVGTYNYLFDDVVTTTYSSNNYVLNYYYRTLDNGFIIVEDGVVDETRNPFIYDDFVSYKEKQAVNANGGNTQLVEGVTKDVLFEINLRKITVTLISFDKVYGIEDNSLYYDLGICATGDEKLIYDEKGNPLCKFEDGVTSTDHGLSPSHKNTYLNNDKTLKQTKFKEDFEVSFIRALGENVNANSYCVSVSGKINGYFTDNTREYSYALGCSASGYEALGVINQADASQLGYNYEITYVKGTMNVIARQIQVTPDSDQGFQYGSYTSGTLIPAITFTNALDRVLYHSNSKKTIGYSLVGEDLMISIINRDESIESTSLEMNDIGLVNGGASDKICLNNIDETNKFCIDDRQNIYDTDVSEMTVSNTGFTMNENGSESVKPTYVFGDLYLDESSTRSALNRKISSSENERYNRNVGTYTITRGDLADKSGNYVIDFSEGVIYKITPANVKITPDANQSKIYGQADKELTFTVQTRYTVNTSQYVVYDSSIYSVGGEIITLGHVSDGKIFVEKDSEVVLNGYAYYENVLDSDDNIITTYNYGKAKSSNKSASVSGVTQLASKVGNSYDKYCYDNYIDNSDNLIGSIAGCSSQNVTFAQTPKILIGYLYIEGYSQKALNNHKILNGFVVANNEFNEDNYVVEFVDSVTFEIIKLDVNLVMKDIEKTYGQATDTNKCEAGANCSGGFATLDAQDNENTLEYNFDIKYKDAASIINASDNMVLMVNSIGGNYYTQSETTEDKNNYLGISVIRVKLEVDGEGNKVSCSVNSDKYGCEDYGTYKLVFRKVEVNKTEKDGSTRYDNNYNLMVDNTNVTFKEVDSSDYVVVNPITHVLETVEKVNLVEAIEGSLSIAKRAIDIYVNTNLNVNESNYYEIEQNVEVPKLPEINNSYDLIGYTYDSSKPYHNYQDPASKSDNVDPALNSTYTKIVWGNQPDQVRTGDALIGQVAYCNEALNGSKYPGQYPGVITKDSEYICGSDSDTVTLVYDANKEIVNTNTKNKFIVITRDVKSDKGLKIRSLNALNVSNNDYEEKNYTASFYPGAVHVVGDSAAPELEVGNKDYYIEANARAGSGATSDSVGTILEYLFNGLDTAYVLVNVNNDGNLFIDFDGNANDVIISQAALQLAYGVDKEGYQGIVSGVEQTGVYPFVSDFAHTSVAGNTSYLNESNIKSLQELITTLIKWFNVTSYDAGQLVNGQYLPRKFDKYYYVAINKYGNDVVNEVNNEFAINKIANYEVRFYVMDNSGRVSDDYNFGRLHIIDTTAPSGGELTLYNAGVKCDENCNEKESWYIADNSIRLNSFNRYNEIDDGNGNKSYVLDAAGTHILFGKLGTQNVYLSLESLRAETGRITTVNYVDYINTGDDKYSALGIEHYSWTSNSSGVHLTITGGSDNSYTNPSDSNDSQWHYYYSVDGGVYWLDYHLVNGMSSYSALISDGTRLIKSMTMDTGVNIVATNEVASINYEISYGDVSVIEVVNKVVVDSIEYSFTESDISLPYFDYDANTRCIINKRATLVTCTTDNDGTEDDVVKVKLTGNSFVYRENTYTIAGDYILTVGGSPHTKIIGETVSLNGVTYRLDRSAMMLYRDYIGTLSNDVVSKDGDGNVISSYTPMQIEGTNYMITIEDVGGVPTKVVKLLSSGATVATVTNDSFVLDGRTYVYYEDAYLTDGYYKHTESHTIINNSFKVDGTIYNMSAFSVDGTYNLVISGVTKGRLRLVKDVTYTTTYELYDRYLIGLNNLYADNAAVAYDQKILTFRHRIVTDNVKWNVATRDAGSVNEEVATYLNITDDAKKVIYKDQKMAYLDTTAPIIGLNITNEISAGVYENVNYGDDWYVFEYGYYNSMVLSEDKKYLLNGVTYTIDMVNSIVTGDDETSAVIEVSGDEDASKKYVYKFDSVSFYIDEGITAIKWVYRYIDEFVGGKDDASKKDVNTAESKYYNLNGSVFGGNVDSDIDDTLGEYDLIKSNTKTDVNAGISGDKYSTSGTPVLYDFVDIGTRSDGIYYEDIDYIVWYYDDAGREVSVELDDEFKACYDNYAGAGSKRVTAECAQEAILEVVDPEGSSGDIVYVINYVVRDKAGNASTYAARGILYASILPGTNVIVNEVDVTPLNNGVNVVNLGNNTYEMNANQGVSLSLLNEAFSVNYSTYKRNYNKSAVMNIYRGEELIVENAKGVNFTDYIDSSQIGEYTIVYSMNANYVPSFGDKIAISGETVTLHLNILAPKLDIESEVNIENIANNETNVIFIFMILGFMAIATLGFVVLKKRKNN